MFHHQRDIIAALRVALQSFKGSQVNLDSNTGHDMIIERFISRLPRAYKSEVKDSHVINNDDDYDDS
mgnify:CR=1